MKSTLSALPVRRFVWIAMLLAGIATCLFIWAQFDRDITLAKNRASKGSLIAQTRCGAIEYQDTGSGMPLLVVHGSGGGFDQGMDFAGDLSNRSVRVIAMSRFGYLRTPMPADAAPPAQADAHVCLLDALGIQKASVLGASAGAPSAMQTAIRHPERISALVLVVPIAYKPGTQADSAAPLSPTIEKFMMRLLGSDFFFWAAMHLARDQVIKHVLATPPEIVEAASEKEKARVHTMLENILPVSLRADGLRSDSVLGKSLPPYPLETIQSPTLIISARDDRYGTYANGQYTATQIPNAQFIGFEEGGHVLVEHNDEMLLHIARFLAAATRS
jgi:2-hydroxy-6-oxonona-2,4-dienedioate hydrolase